MISPEDAKKTGSHTTENAWFDKVWLQKSKQNISRKTINFSKTVE